MKTYSYLALSLLLAASVSSVYTMDLDADGGGSSVPCQRNLHNDQLLALLEGRISGPATADQTAAVDPRVVAAVTGLLGRVETAEARSSAPAECSRQHVTPRTQRRALAEKGAFAAAGAGLVLVGQRVVPVAIGWWKNR